MTWMVVALVVVSLLSLGLTTMVLMVSTKHFAETCDLIQSVEVAIQRASVSPVPPPWLERLSPYVPAVPPRCIVCGYAIPGEAHTVRGGIVHRGACHAIFGGVHES